MMISRWEQQNPKVPGHRDCEVVGLANAEIHRVCVDWVGVVSFSNQSDRASAGFGIGRRVSNLFFGCCAHCILNLMSTSMAAEWKLEVLADDYEQQLRLGT